MNINNLNDAVQQVATFRSDSQLVVDWVQTIALKS